jgi:hypothetical protein
MVKWAQQKETPRTYRADISRKWGTGTFSVDVTDDQNHFINNLDLKIRVLFPSKVDRTISLEQIEPGRYQGYFPTEEIGEYYISLFSAESKVLSLSKIYGYGIPYTDEFYTRGVNNDLLTRLATLTKGRVLSVEDNPQDLFTVQSDTKIYGRRLWPYLTLMFLLLLIFDVGLRKFQSIGRIS